MRPPLISVASCLTGLISLLPVTAAPARGAPPAQSTPAAARPQVIVLKFDDVAAPVSARWLHLTDYLGKNGLKGSYGVIADSLEQDQPDYFRWINDVRKRGSIEFWLHGYHSRKESEPTGEFEHGSYEEQRAVFERSERLAREKLGFAFNVFGPHWSATTVETERAVAATPELDTWFYGPEKPQYFKGFVFESVLTLEDPTFVPDFDKFRATYERAAANKPVLALQGHPNMWDEARWEGFVKIVTFLRERGCMFMTPTEYIRSTAHAAR